MSSLITEFQMEECFGKIVQHIFNNWTALKLAVEHSMGGPNSKETALECMNYMVQYCLYEPNAQHASIQDALEDILDEEFDLICEDESPKEVASVLYKFSQLVKQGNLEECELEFQKLPTINTDWLSQSKSHQTPQPAEESDSSSSEEATNETPMEEDGWTEVKSRRKK